MLAAAATWLQLSAAAPPTLLIYIYIYIVQECCTNLRLVALKSGKQSSETCKQILSPDAHGKMTPRAQKGKSQISDLTAQPPLYAPMVGDACSTHPSSGGVKVVWMFISISVGHNTYLPLQVDCFVPQTDQNTPRTVQGLSKYPDNPECMLLLSTIDQVCLLQQSPPRTDPTLLRNASHA